MLEIFHLIVGYLLSAGNGVQHDHDPDMRRRTGAAMFDCYLRFVEVTTAAGSIVDEVQNYVWRAEKDQGGGRDFQHATSELQEICNQ